MTTELTQKLENIISGHSINEDDADWLRALTASQPEQAESDEAFLPRRLAATQRLKQLGYHYDAEQGHWLPTQPAAQTDSMGMPTSCGKPLCLPDEHHPLCKLHKPAAQAAPEPVARSRECTEPMCACMGGPCAECPEGEREKEIADLRTSRDFYKRRADALQQAQSHMRDPERTMVCDILANGALLVPAGDRYAATPEPVGEPFAWTSMGQIRFTPPTQDHDTYTPLYTHLAPGVPEDVRRNAARWGTIKASKPQLGISWLGVPFVGFEFTGPANKAWADSVKSGLDVDDAMDAAMLAAAQAKGGDHG